MKFTQYFVLLWSRCCLKKSLILCKDLKCFFRPAISFPTGLYFCFRTAVTGLLVDLTDLYLQSKPVTVLISQCHPTNCGRSDFTLPSISLRYQAVRIARGGRQSFQRSSLSTVVLAGRFVRNGSVRLKVTSGRVLLRTNRFLLFNRASGYSCVLFRGPRGPQPVPLCHYV